MREVLESITDEQVEQMLAVYDGIDSTDYWEAWSPIYNALKSENRIKTLHEQMELVKETLSGPVREIVGNFLMTRLCEDLRGMYGITEEGIELVGRPWVSVMGITQA